MLYILYNCHFILYNCNFLSHDETLYCNFIPHIYFTLKLQFYISHNFILYNDTLSQLHFTISALYGTLYSYFQLATITCVIFYSVVEKKISNKILIVCSTEKNYSQPTGLEKHFLGEILL